MSIYALLATAIPATYSLPIHTRSLNPVSTQSLVNLTQNQINPFLVPARFSRAAYCNSTQVQQLTCGDACTALGNVEVLIAKGDNAKLPRFFVAHDVDGGQIVVSHQGTNTSDFQSVANDVDIAPVALSSSSFPNQPSGVLVHEGFQDTWQRSASDVLSTVQNAIKQTGVKKVLVTGHSLGAAVSLLDAMMLRTTLDTSIEMTTVLFGLPRVGNQEWANFVDATIGSTFNRITNGQDPIPIVPPRALDYSHPSGEVHIFPGNVTVACPGQENAACQEGHSILKEHFADHKGPYFTAAIKMGGGSCAGHDQLF